MTEIITRTKDGEFQHVLDIISGRRARASQAVNDEVLFCAWEVGGFVSHRIKDGVWGSKTVTELSEYLRTQNPTLRGYGRRNIYNMISLYDTYSSLAFREYAERFQLNQVKKQIVQFETAQTEEDPIVQFETAQIPSFLNLTTFTNHIEILNRCKTVEERVFYIMYAYKERLNIKELRRSIKTDAFSSLAVGKHVVSKGMATIYPRSPVLFKDELFVDFLGLPKKHSEKRLRTGLIDHMKSFILELGKDFIYIDTEFPVNVGGSIFKIDLLFFHRSLQCLVAVELKANDFEPKDIGQLEFYLEALDRDVKRSNENPSIGILLCRRANKSVVEYAMSRSMSPTMVAEYKRLLIPKEVLRKTLDEYGDFFMDDDEK